MSIPSVGSNVQRVCRLGRRLLAPVLAPVTAWLVAAGACAAFAVVALAQPGIPSVAAASSLPLPKRARAVQVEGAFARMTPFSVQPHMGASRGKDATCSIYSDGNLDTGARVTWAVTLCTVHAVGKPSSH